MNFGRIPDVGSGVWRSDCMPGEDESKQLPLETARPKLTEEQRREKTEHAAAELEAWMRRQDRGPTNLKIVDVSRQRTPPRT